MTADQRVTKSIARAAAIAVVAVGASACSSIPEWADPTGWIGGTDKTAEDSSGTQAPTPDLAAIPDKPAPPSTADERKEVSQSLAADRADAQYSGDALRGGTDPSAPPPPDAAPATTESLASTAPSASTPQADASATDRTASADSSAQPAEQPSAQAAATPAVAPAQEADTASSAPAPSQDQTTAQAPAQVASVNPAEPAPVAAAPLPAPSAGADPLGFQPSRAPALDPSVANFVPKAVLQRYEQNSPGSTPAADEAAPKKADANQTSSTDDPSTDSRMSGRMAATSHASAMLTSAAYTPGRSTSPQTVIFFPGEAAALNAKARSQILAAAQTFQSHGASSYIRVVGHSSSRTGDMPLARHLDVVFQHSQEFASAVAHELIRDGVPADKVLIEAVGDSQPVYYESMPQGEAGNRRAEIFL